VAKTLFRDQSLDTPSLGLTPLVYFAAPSALSLVWLSRFFGLIICFLFNISNGYRSINLVWLTRFGNPINGGDSAFFTLHLLTTWFGCPFSVTYFGDDLDQFLFTCTHFTLHNNSFHGPIPSLFRLDVIYYGSFSISGEIRRKYFARFFGVATATSSLLIVLVVSGVLLHIIFLISQWKI
jgi:hypothetical protein